MLNELARLGPLPTLILQATVLLSLGLLGSLLLHARPARAHALLTLSVLGCLALPIISGVVRVNEWGVLSAGSEPRQAGPVVHDGFSAGSDVEMLPARPRAIAPASPASVVPPVHVQGAAAGSPARAIPWSQIAILGWLAASAVLLVRLVWSFAAARRLLRHAEPLRDGALERALAEASRRLGLRTPASAWKLPGSRCPAIWCWRRQPMLVLPSEGMPDDAGVIRHEIAHAARLDHVWAIAADLLVCLVPWHPVAWAARRRMALLSERACDEWALEGARDSSAAQYASALLAYAPRSGPRLALGVTGSRGTLSTRVRAILHAARCDPRAGRAWRSVAAAVALAAVVGAALAQPGAAPVRQPEAPKATEPGKQPAAKQPAGNADEIKARLQALDDQNWREAFQVGQDLAALPADQGFALLSENWKTLPVEAKQQMLKAWNYAMPFPLHQRLHPRLVDVLDLGVSDPNTNVQSWAFNFLKQVAVRDFTSNFNEYTAWRAATQGKQTEAVIVQGIHDWVDRLRSENAEIRDEAAALARDADMAMRDVPAAKNEALKSGVLDHAATWFVPGTPRPLQEAASELVSVLSPPEAYLRKVVLPAAVNTKDSGLRDRAVRLLGSSKGWAYEPLAKILRDQFEAGGDAGGLYLSSVAGSLGEIGDPRAIPLMIAIIDADNTYSTVYGVGYFGLGKLTGVRYDEKHDGAWWRDWWDKNKARFPADVQALPIEKLTAPAKRQAAGEPAEPDALADVADVPSQRITLGGDKHKQYFLIGPKAASKEPATGRNLLVVLPGGSGGEDFNPFVRRILKNAAPDYVIAQPIAPVWRDGEDRVVWPTAKLPDDKMAFPTEQFVREVIEDVRSRQKIDARHVYLLGWSSGGPPVYTCLATPDMPVTGAFVAMSVFKPETMPPLDGVKGRAVYVLHSPQDFIKMTFPNAAVEKLSAAGGKVKLETYEGGHGWHGDVFGNIQRGIRWLESQ